MEFQSHHCERQHRDVLRSAGPRGERGRNYIGETSDSTISGNRGGQQQRDGDLPDPGIHRSDFVGNEASYNAYGWERNANGIDVISPGNTIIKNVVHNNENSGIHFYPGGNNNVAADNLGL